MKCQLSFENQDTYKLIRSYWLIGGILGWVIRSHARLHVRSDKKIHSKTFNISNSSLHAGWSPKVGAFLNKTRGIGWDNTSQVWPCILGKSARDMVFTHCKAWGGGFHEPKHM
jgi:hypothetical protein